MATKLTQEELDNLKNLKERSDSKVYEFGQLEIEMLLTHQYLESLTVRLISRKVNLYLTNRLFGQLIPYLYKT